MTESWYISSATTTPRRRSGGDPLQTLECRWIWSGHPSLVLFTAAPWVGVHTLENDAQARDVLSLFAGYRRAWASGHWLWGYSSRAGLSQFPRFKTGLSCLDGLFGSRGSVAFCSHCLDQRRRTVLSAGTCGLAVVTSKSLRRCQFGFLAPGRSHFYINT